MFGIPYTGDAGKKPTSPRLPKPNHTPAAAAALAAARYHAPQRIVGKQAVAVDGDTAPRTFAFLIFVSSHKRPDRTVNEGSAEVSQPILMSQSLVCKVSISRTKQWRMQGFSYASVFDRGRT
jgi:hypothetical protein